MGHAQDLANQVRHSVQYQKALNGAKPGRYLTVEAGEYLSGLPLGWTMPHSLNDEVEMEIRSKASRCLNRGMACQAFPLRGISLFTGVGGFDVGLKSPARPVSIVRVCHLQLWRPQTRLMDLSLSGNFETTVRTVGVNQIAVQWLSCR